MTDRNRPVPHSALIPMFLAMSQGQGNLEQTLDDLLQFIQSTKNAMQAMRSGMDTFQTGMLKMAFTPSAGGQKKKETVPSLPVEYPDKQGDS